MNQSDRREVYRIKVVPVCGPTLAERTRQEWSLGYTFKVVFSGSPLFAVNSRITSGDIADQEHYHPVTYNVDFEVLTIKEYLTQQAENSHGFAESLTDAGYLLKGGIQ